MTVFVATRTTLAALLLLPVGLIALALACLLALSLGTAVLVAGLVPVRRAADAVIRAG
jgi:hypothetical protein